MPYFSTSALVLRTAEYKDNDKMLTLLTPDRGLVSAAARGCRRPKSQLMACANVFVCGDFVLYEKSGRVSVNSCAITEAFYSLRTDLDALQNAAYCGKWCEYTAQADQPAQELMSLMLATLAHLAYGEMRPGRVTAAFLAHMCEILGVRPVLGACASCGRPLSGAIRWNPGAGGASCAVCAPQWPSASLEALEAIDEFMQTPAARFGEVGCGDDAAREARSLLRFHMETLLGAPSEKPKKRI